MTDSPSLLLLREELAREAEKHQYVPATSPLAKISVVLSLLDQLEGMRGALEEIARCDPKPTLRNNYTGGFDQGAAWASRVARQALTASDRREQKSPDTEGNTE